jgi:fermentation-respiration switch protein FrsA (DUF1100 family)
MTELWITLGVLGGVGVLVLLTAFICFRMAFYVTNRSKVDGEKFSLPPGKEYVPHHDQMQAWHNEVSSIPYRTLTVRSFDGLTLYGKYYEYAPGAPIELMFHGYRGSAERDMPGGAQRCFRAGRSALLVDQRASGQSDGSVISFGINECRDCLAWVDFAVKKFGPQRKLILTGISMGAATVMMAAGEELPDNVIGILADCGYSSPKEIICKVIRQLGLPTKAMYPLVKLGAKLYGQFDLEANSPVDALKRAKKPVIFLHGEADDFVPCEMSKACFDVCASRKQLVTIPGAGHGLAYPVDKERYLSALREFFGADASAEK